MNRILLEQINIEGLRELAGQHGLGARGTRAILFDRLTDHFERAGWPEQVAPNGTETQHTERSLNVPSENSNEYRDMRTTDSTNNTNDNQQGARISEQMTTNGLQSINMEEIIRSITKAFEEAQRPMMQPVNDNVLPSASGTTFPVSSPIQSTAYQNWNQIKFTAKLIPQFSGKEDENVLVWIYRVSRVARMYQAPDEVLVMAAINQLTGRALDWYNRQDIESVATWENLKFYLRSYFERKETFTVTLSKVNSRIWRSHMEKFMDYAEDKLKLMQPLKISEKERIELLADGVKDTFLRRFVLNSSAKTVPELIEYVRKITEDSLMVKKLDNQPLVKRPNSRFAKVCFSCKKPGHLAQDCRVSKPTCFRCGQTGHLSSSCPKKRQNQESLNHVNEQTVSLESSPEATSTSSAAKAAESICTNT